MINIGSEFGNLTVIGRTKDNKEMVCRCDCMAILKVSERQLTRTDKPSKTSCGCVNGKFGFKKSSKTSLEDRYSNVVGTTIGYLTILGVFYKKHQTGNNLAYAVCKCRCMNFFTTLMRGIVSGRTKTCNCLSTEKSSKRMSIFNKSHKGINHTQYNTNITDEERINKRNFWSPYFSYLTFKRDNFLCKKCGCVSTKDNKLEAHHADSWSLLKEQGRMDISCDINNCVTFCQSCHDEYHSIYGKSLTTREQTIEYLGFTPFHMRYDPIYLGA